MIKNIFKTTLLLLFASFTMQAAAQEICYDFDDKMNAITIDCITKKRIYTAAEKEEIKRQQQEAEALERSRQEELARQEQERQAQEKARQEEAARLEQERLQKEQERLQKEKERKEAAAKAAELKLISKQKEKEAGYRGTDFFLRAGGFAGKETRKGDSSAYTISEEKVDSVGLNIGAGVRFYGKPNEDSNVKYYGDVELFFAGGSEALDLYVQAAGGYYLTQKLSLRLGGGLGMVKREIEFNHTLYGTQYGKLDKTGYKLFGGLEYELSHRLNIYAEYSYVSSVNAGLNVNGQSVDTTVDSTGNIHVGLRLMF